MSNTEHSDVGASGNHRWIPCAGSIWLSKTVTEYTNPAAEKGTDAHTLGEICFLEGSDTLDYVGEVMPLGNEVDTDMAVAVQLYLDTIRDYIAHYEKEFGEVEYGVEQRFNLNEIHPKMFGTNDFYLYAPKARHLVIFDYKNGFGLVEVEGNTQLKQYGVGAMWTRPVDTIEIAIVQPNVYHPDGPVRSETLEAYDLIEFALELKEAAKNTDDPNAPRVPGAQCKYCPAAPICPELMAKAKDMSEKTFEKGKYDPEELAEAITWIDTVFSTWVKRTREFAVNEANNGRQPPGFKLVKSKSRVKWAVAKSAIIKAFEGVEMLKRGYKGRKVKRDALITVKSNVRRCLV